MPDSIDKSEETILPLYFMAPKADIPTVLFTCIRIQGSNSWPDALV